VSSAAAGNPRGDLTRIFRAAIAAVAPERLVAGALAGAAPGTENVPSVISSANAIYLLAVGKAAAGMASEIARAFGVKLRAGLAIVPDGAHAHMPGNVVVMRSAHPVPDASSLAAARAATEFAARPGAGDLLLVAISGGASAMLAMPPAAITLEDKVAVTSALLRASASVRELNLVRKHLSAIKGGRLLRAVNERARVMSLVISDVPGNDLSTIGSGLTAADPTTYADAIAVLKRHHGLWGRTPESVREHLELGAAGRIEETVKPGDAALERVTNVIIGDNDAALTAAEEEARALGYSADRWRELRGEANDVGRALAAHLCAIETQRLCVLAGGEPVVTVKGAGRGGRAQQCALAMAIELARIGHGRRIAALFAGSDGIDGPTDAAGAFAAPDTVERALAARADPEQALGRNDAYGLFKPLDDLLVTGPTGTNVSDLFVGLVNY
jgi:glycerate 2-kinase